MRLQMFYSWKTRLLTFALALIMALVSTMPTFGQSTAFTYQGSLTENGGPANGVFQFRFRLFDAAMDGGQVGSTISNVDLNVADGTFTANLDFGVNAFPGADRYLEVSVRHNSGESYIVLDPRQKIYASPYSLRTLSAAQADEATHANTASLATNAENLGGVPASDYMTDAEANATYIKNGTTSQTANFWISGNGTISTQLGVGKTPTAGYRIDSMGNVRSIDSGPTSFTAETTGGTNSWARYYMNTLSQSWLMGTSQNFNGNQFYLTDNTAGHLRFFIQPNGGPINFPLGNVGIGTTEGPSSKLFVNGGQPWSSGGWLSSVELANASSIGWRNNTAGQSHGIGQTNGGMYFFRTSANPGTNIGAPINYDLLISDEGNLSLLGGATQARDKGGWAKALINVDALGGIDNCYNGLTGSSSGNCGFSVTRVRAGEYTINLGFSVRDRFVSVSGVETNAAYFVSDSEPNILIVATYYTWGTFLDVFGFTAIVF